MPYGTPQSATFVMTVGKPQSAGDPMPNAFCGFSFLRQMNASERMMRKTAKFVLMAAMPVLPNACTAASGTAPLLGADRDAHGCIDSAEYVWSALFKSVKNEAAAH